MSTDNRYHRNDCEANTGWTGDDTANPISDAGSFIEGSGALSTQLSNADERMATTQDSTAAGTFSVNFSDRTIYANVKDNLGNSYANNGIQIVIGDGTDEIGYSVGGNNARGILGQLFYSVYKLDCSESAATPGNHAVYAGTEANLTYTAITQVGYGANHLAKAVGSVDNVTMDGFYDIANGSYALTINGGTAGTPETMADVVTDDEASGWHMVFNPLGSQYVFFAPTEFGNASTVAEHALTATNEQWFWVGDNAGGRAVGATHFPFRVIGNSTDTGSFIITNVVIVNTGTAAEFDCSSSEVNTLEIDGCTMNGLASIEAPASGGTSRFFTNNIMINCGTVTSNLCSMTGNSYLTPTVAADTGALVYDEALATPKVLSTLDNSTFTQGTNAHHAISFGTGIDEDITLTGLELSGFSSTDNVDGSTFQFLATTGTIDLSLIGCTIDGVAVTAPDIGIDDAAGITVSLVIDPVNMDWHVVDKNNVAVSGAQVTAFLVSDNSSIMTATDTNGSGDVSTTYSGSTPVSIYYRVRKASTGATKYKNFSAFGTIETGTGLSVTVILTEDTNNAT